MGPRSFGSTGQPLPFALPGGGSARVCTKNDAYSTGQEFVGYGIKPEVEVRPTLQDYLTRQEPTLAKAIAYLRKRLK